MSEQKRCEVYGPNHKATKIGLELKEKKDASKNNKLPQGALKKRLVEERMISDIDTKKLKGEEKNVYTYVGRIVNGKRTVAKPCSTKQKLTNQRTRRRGKSGIKKIMKTKGGDVGGMI